jgi:hypothetical protein
VPLWVSVWLNGMALVGYGTGGETGSGSVIVSRIVVVEEDERGGLPGSDWIGLRSWFAGRIEGVGRTVLT